MAATTSKIVFTGVFAVIALSVLGAFFTGWILMLLVGALWHEFGWLEPIGYWPAVGISFLFHILLAVVVGNRD